MATTLELDVEVTQDDIDQGKASSCYECPGALAINRALGECLGEGLFSAGIGSIILVRRTDAPNDPMPYFIGSAPSELNHLIARVDMPSIYGPAEPVSFHLSLHARH